ncbi:MFS transporter [Cytophaga aurantiaca]|uniref:MFS transporter n=1 Tax=Cytophaga aurantiaca TaxID=29530 RepID=UPI000363E3C0|nr:MFS transporter [Cytophaga aurantiaca]
MTNKKTLAILLTANGVSSFAQGFTMMSIPYYFNKIGDYSFFSLSLTVITLVSLFWALYAGSIIDGFNRKDVFLGTNFVGGIVILSIASLGFKEGELTNILIILVYALTMFGYVIHYPNLYAFSQELSEPKDYTKITSLIEIVGQSTVMGSAIMGTMLLKGITDFHVPFSNSVITIERWEIHEIFLFDAIAYFVSFLIILLIKYSPNMKLVISDEGSLYERLKTGYMYLKNNQLVALFGICSFTIFIVVYIEQFALMTPYVLNHLHEDAPVLGLTELMYGLGALFSGVIIQTLFSKMPVLKAVVLLTFATGAIFLLSSMTCAIIVFINVAFLKGFTNASSRIFRVTYLFSLIPNELAGRVNSFFNVMNTVFRLIFLSMFTLPFFMEGSNVVYAYGILAVFCFIAGVVLLIYYKQFSQLTEGMSSHDNDH